MRFLKNKVRLVPNIKEDPVKEEPRSAPINHSAIKQESNENDFSLNTKKESFLDSSAFYVKRESSGDSFQTYEEVPLLERNKKKKAPNPDGNSKNLVKNYGKALCMFASSTMAIPYLEKIIAAKRLKDVKIFAFMNFYKKKKGGITNIESLRTLLVAERDDTPEIKIFKQLFKEVSIIFLKYFCVNWIFNGKLLHKNEHLKFRLRMLRRVQNAEYFTYLRS